MLFRVVVCLLFVLWLGGATCLGEPPLTLDGLQHQHRCVQALQQRQLDVARANCALCLEHMPSSPECLNAMGLHWYLRGDDAQARALYKHAIRTRPDFAEARNNLGALERDAGELDAARQLFASATSIAPGYRDARYNLASTILLQAQRARARGGSTPTVERRLAEAELEYLKLAQQEPNAARAHADLAVIETLRADLSTERGPLHAYLELARDHLLQCLRLDAQQLACSGNLGHVLLLLGQCADAETLLQYCLTLDQDNVVCQRELALAHRCALAQESALSPEDLL